MKIKENEDREIPEPRNNPPPKKKTTTKNKKKTQNKQTVEHEGDIILIVIAMLETVPKSLKVELEELEIRERIKTIQTTVLLRSARILGRVLETWTDLFLQRPQ